ncbi:hypothetical protein BOTBODRAFT_33463 [Botryobasidium botryosum FD-172 SS1]|uniref:Protoheme IX farnesyltransferase, mitochondrial n=1 Tax=Botryobasidium botryosum (strain FD-172 SS1) TaxID=930990 RepID=A0A067MCG0_BOTB1|nr:hypothetical protein BOTBODRAFT_33463 [Botryobasidium botryosum FD-172 SS1]
MSGKHRLCSHHLAGYSKLRSPTHIPLPRPRQFHTSKPTSSALSLSSTLKTPYLNLNSIKSSKSSLFFFSNGRWASEGALAYPRESASRDANVALDASNELVRPLYTNIDVSLDVSTPYPPPPLESYKPIPALTPKRLLRAYSQLSKARLTTLVVLTAMSGVALSPLPATVPVLLATALGTALCAASANTFNQLSEAPLDAQMARTRNRPLVRRAVTPLHAAGFGLATGLAGPALLYAFVNPTTAILGAFNIFLYAGVYTPMKRVTVVNTWVGAVVGVLPPVMGWTACGGRILPSSTYPIELFPPSFLSDLPLPALELVDNPLSVFALSALLFAWQFPHFNAFSHMVRDSYAQAGYRMLAVTNPQHNALVSLRYTALMLPICSVITPLAGLTTWVFALTSLVPNLMLLRASIAFWKSGAEKEAKKLFHTSLWYLPVVLGLMMFHKQGMAWSEWLGLTEPKSALGVPADVVDPSIDKDKET